MEVKLKTNLQHLARLRSVDVTNSLLEGAQRFVAGSIRDNLKKSVDENDQTFKPLANQRGGVRSNFKKGIFLKSKHARGVVRSARSQSKPLIDTGKLLNSVKAVRFGFNKVVVRIRRADRKDIAVYQHFGTDKIPARPFFGIRPSQLAKVRRQVIQILKRDIERATSGRL